MEIGKKRRLERFFDQNGKTVIVPMDHGVTLGPISGLINLQGLIDKLVLGKSDAVLLHKGIAESIDTRGMGLIVHLNASTVLSPDPHWKIPICSVEQAIRLGADCVSIHLNIGAEKENQMLNYMGTVSDRCTTYGVPLLAMIYPRGAYINERNNSKSSDFDTDLIKHAVRIGFELGADVVKTNYTGSVDTFREVTKACLIPVVIAGGPKMDTSRDLLRMVYDSIQAGGAGVAIGRNIFQHKNPRAIVSAISAIVHNSATVDDGLKILGEI